MLETPSRGPNSSSRCLGHPSAARRPSRRSTLAVLLLLPRIGHGQEIQPEQPPDPDQDGAPVADEIDIAPATSDSAIASRLGQILEATGWFDDASVHVEQGVVFLQGEVSEEAQRDWAQELAANTEDVVAVVNRIETAERSILDLSPAWSELRQLGRAAVRASPLIAIGLLLLVLTLFATRWTTSGARTVLRRRVRSQLLRDVTARVIAVPVFLFGLYLVLQVAGLTGLAVTVVGGTGLLGLIVGFAFREIAENFLASILLSMQQPFARGDLIKVGEHTGYVQSVNTRATLLMTQDGNHVQIPNATIYKQPITNLTANPNTRHDFVVGIGYEDSIAEAQSIVLAVLCEHEAVLDDPEPLVLVEALGAATVNLRVYFWIDIGRYSHLRVKSAVIRLVKRALDAAQISLPDEAREVVFPRSVPVQMISAPPEAGAPEPSADRPGVPSPEPEVDTQEAEGGLVSDARDIAQQARRARRPEGGTDLLE